MAGPINNNPYLQQVLFQNLSSTDIQPGQLKNSAQLISSAYAAKSGVATISANGAKINNASNTIRATGDMQAYEGFRAAVGKAGSGSDPLQLIRFANSADFAAKNDANALNSAFAGLARNMGSSSDAMLDGFNAAFSSTVEKTGMSGLELFNKGFSAVEEADYSGAKVSRSENLHKYFSLVNQINSEADDESAALSELGRLTRGIELGKLGDSIWNYFNDFIGSDPQTSV
jgi:hypothetical protein